MNQDINNKEYKPRRNDVIAYWVDYIIWKNGESFWESLKRLPVSRFTSELKKAVNMPVEVERLEKKS